MRTALVIMAAGMGNRFGGSKQTTPVDDAGNKIIDYSMYDAKNAGFDEVVFVIKEEMYESFREDIGKNVEKYFDVSYVFQKIDGTGIEVPEGRVKPWGTGQAVLCAADCVKVPFAVINADDFYGADAFVKMHDFLAGERMQGEYSMVGYMLKNTVTENGSVSRGVCTVDEASYLTAITEHTKIYQNTGGIEYTEDDGKTFAALPDDTVVSMNFWGFGPEFFEVLRAGFAEFLEGEMKSDPLKKEYYLPTGVDSAMKSGASVKVLATDAKWHGITYREDLDAVKSAIACMKRNGEYPENLWDN